ncbi:MAG TPA: hypothetical protein VIK02_02835 [Candidatus Anoxymicrobiaceae bacterium]|jgi:hypothetical protein
MTLDDKEELKIQKRIARAEKKAMKLGGVDQGLIHRFWELVNMFPKISTPELERRVEHFIMTAAPGQYFLMQQAIFQEATPYLVEDERMRHLMDELAGKKIGLSIPGEYESTVTLDQRCFQVRRGIVENVPVISCMSRKDYADAILLKADPIKMILGRRIRASRKFTLLRWVLPHIEVLRDRSLFDKYLGYQPEVEKVIEENLTRMGY